MMIRTQASSRGLLLLLWIFAAILNGRRIDVSRMMNGMRRPGRPCRNECMSEKNIAVPVEGEATGDGRDMCYVGFCDILGLSNRILTDVDETLKIYKQFGASVSGLPIKGTQVTMYSDAVLVTGESLGRVLAAVQALWFVALANDLMIRGAVTQGRHWEQRDGNHLLVASDVTRVRRWRLSSPC